MTEETVYNVEQGTRSVNIFCNWCLETFEYKEDAGVAHNNTTCPWCRSKITIPRDKLRRINGVSRR